MTKMLFCLVWGTGWRIFVSLGTYCIICFPKRSSISFTLNLWIKHYSCFAIINGCCWNIIISFFWLFVIPIFWMCTSSFKAVEILEAYEGTLDEDHPPENERCEHGEMLLYKVFLWLCVCSCFFFNALCLFKYWCLM